MPWTGFLATLSEFDVEDAVMQNLKNSMVRYLDSQAGIIFTSAELVAQCASTASVVFTTNGTATTTANSDLTGFNWRKIADDMQSRNIPFYDGESYICIGTIKAISGLFNDTATSGFVDVRLKLRPQPVMVDVKLDYIGGKLEQLIPRKDWTMICPKSVESIRQAPTLG